MSKLGTFDAALRRESLFDPALLIEGWYAEDLIDAPATGVQTITLALIASGELVTPLSVTLNVAPGSIPTGESMSLLVGSEVEPCAAIDRFRVRA
jgi:hypothetical protein